MTLSVEAPRNAAAAAEQFMAQLQHDESLGQAMVEERNNDMSESDDGLDAEEFIEQRRVSQGRSRKQRKRHRQMINRGRRKRPYVGSN